MKHIDGQHALQALRLSSVPPRRFQKLARFPERSAGVPASAPRRCQLMKLRVAVSAKGDERRAGTEGLALRPAGVRVRATSLGAKHAHRWGAAGHAHGRWRATTAAVARPADAADDDAGPLASDNAPTSLKRLTVILLCAVRRDPASLPRLAPL